ncbi:TPA: TlyA family RNA methyltransferase [Candidatus Bipolaricaulota bacterium]|nr:TlyA family RNA methyltransferase [Candidatus Bipolaricaulota bacterium]
MKGKLRLDQLLVARGLAESRAKAQALIRAGQVLVDGQLRDKPGSLVREDAEVFLKEKPRYVSRGGDKLAAALEAFGIDPKGKVCLDIGASTGGFTDCLLQHGARKAYAVDVGRGQLHWKLRTDPRVVVREGLNARYLSVEDIGEPVDLVTIDVSFISLRLVLPPLKGIVKRDGDVIALVKPQFEAGRGQVGRGGVVRDPRVHREVLQGIAEFVEELGCSVAGAIRSPLRGPAGNVEFLFHILPRPGASSPLNWQELIQAADPGPGA